MTIPSITLKINNRTLISANKFKNGKWHITQEEVKKQPWWKNQEIKITKRIISRSATNESVQQLICGVIKLTGEKNTWKNRWGDRYNIIPPSISGRKAVFQFLIRSGKIKT